MNAGAASTGRGVEGCPCAQLVRLSDGRALLSEREPARGKQSCESPGSTDEGGACESWVGELAEGRGWRGTD